MSVMLYRSLLNQVISATKDVDTYWCYLHWSRRVSSRAAAKSMAGHCSHTVVIHLLSWPREGNANHLSTNEGVVAFVCVCVRINEGFLKPRHKGRKAGERKRWRRGE